MAEYIYIYPATYTGKIWEALCQIEVKMNENINYSGWGASNAVAWTESNPDQPQS